VIHPDTSASLLTGKTIGGPAAARFTIDGREYINFCGSGYLALSAVPEIRVAVFQALQQGVPFARHMAARTGAIDPIFRAIEHAGAVACRTEASVYFASGYLIGAVGLACLAGSFDVLVRDEDAHYNLCDATKQCERPSFTFAHCDPESLAQVLKKHVRAGQRPLVVTDGAVATTGRIPPLADYGAVLEAYDGRMFVDESHSFGVVGENGRGAAEHCGAEQLATIGATLSKAYCAHGAIIGCSAEQALRLQATPPIRGANAGSPLSAAAANASLRYVASRPVLRTRLRAMTDYLRMRLRARGVEVIDSPAPIVAFQCGSPADMQALQRRAWDRGIYVAYVPPGGYAGAGRQGMLRCAVFRDHSQHDIDELVATVG
jgi:8-amino-7-oxononanoate synthase